MKTEEIEILLVEDSLFDAELTIRALKKHNLADKLIHVLDGVEALDFIFGTGLYSERSVEKQPKVIFLDLKLPKVDGFQVLSKLKSHELTRKIPVVIFTSSVEVCDIAESYRLGANSYINKPIDFSKFMDTVSKLGLYWLSANMTPNVSIELL